MHITVNTKPPLSHYLLSYERHYEGRVTVAGIGDSKIQIGVISNFLQAQISLILTYAVRGRWT